jgi:hypothetical protein
MVSPLDTCSNAADGAIGVFLTLTPILVDSILLLRLIAVYPPSITPTRKFVLILAFPVLAKIVRFTCTTAFLIELVKTADEVGNFFVASEITWARLPWSKMELFVATFDNLLS